MVLSEIPNFQIDHAAERRRADAIARLRRARKREIRVAREGEDTTLLSREKAKIASQIGEVPKHPKPEIDEKEHIALELDGVIRPRDIPQRDVESDFGNTEESIDLTPATEVNSEEEGLDDENPFRAVSGLINDHFSEESRTAEQDLRQAKPHSPRRELMELEFNTPLARLAEAMYREGPLVKGDLVEGEDLQLSVVLGSVLNAGEIRELAYDSEREQLQAFEEVQTHLEFSE